MNPVYTTQDRQVVMEVIPLNCFQYLGIASLDEKKQGLAEGCGVRVLKIGGIVRRLDPAQQAMGLDWMYATGFSNQTSRRLNSQTERAQPLKRRKAFTQQQMAEYYGDQKLAQPQ